MAKRAKGKSLKKVVVIAASAGGITALEEVISSLPRNLPAAVLLAQHLLPDHKTRLHEYLASRSRMLVCLAEKGQPIEPGVVYVSVPGQHLCVKDGHISIYKGKPVNYVWPSADVLFKSAAKEYGRRVIGVVLTGTGKDGTQGCREIKARGGITIAQDKGTSHSFGMPGAAISSGSIDFVLPLDKISRKIVNLITRR